VALGGFLSDSPISAIWRYNGNEKETEEEGWGRGSLILAQGKTGS